MRNFLIHQILREAADGTSGAPGDPAPYVPIAEFQKLQENFGKTVGSVAAMSRKFDSVLTADKLADALAGLGLVEKAEDGSYRPKSAAAPGKPEKTEGDPRVKAMEAEIAELKKTAQAAQEMARQKDEQALASARDNAIVTALGKAGAISPDEDYVKLQSKVVRNERGEFVVKGQDRYGSEIEIPLEKYADEWLTARPHLKKATGQAGTGTPTGSPTPGTKLASGKIAVSRAEAFTPQWQMAHSHELNKYQFV